MRTKTWVSTTVLLSAALVAPVSGQSDATAAGGTDPAVTWPMPPVHWEGAGITETTREQIQEVAAAVRHLGEPATARESGFRPALGMIPTMGEHWVNVRAMTSPFDRVRPPHLMFSLVNGEEQLVGAAYAFQRAPDAPIPDGFDGDADLWHDHAELAIGDQTLTMLHVWFVPSPDGPFAGHNPWLAFWAVGMEPPARSGMSELPEDGRVRAVSLALAESYGSSVGGSTLARALGTRREERAAAMAEREEIRALIPALRQAQASDDLAAWNLVADEMISVWEGVQEARLAAIPIPQVRDRLAAFYDEMLTGGHGAASHTPAAAPHVH
jgi:hypothetical protein